MKTFILCFPAIEWDKIQMPIGLYKIAAYCKAYYNVVILDERLQDAENEINKLLASEDVLCLGFSVMIGSQITNALRLSKRFHGKIPIVWGGPLPTILPEVVLSNEYVDYIVRGDGEAAVLSLLTSIDKETMDNWDDGKIHVFQNLPMSNIDYSHIEIPDEYFISRDGFRRAIALETSRGCPHACAFCHNTSLKHPYRYICAETVKKTIDFLINRFNIDGVIFQEDNMFVDRRRAMEIIGFLEKTPEVGWKANSRIDYFKKLVCDRDFMDLLVNSGCHTLQFGIESGSIRILKMINKKITPGDVISVNRALSQYNINLRYNFIIGFPTETEEEVLSTIQLAEQLQKDNKHVEPPFINIYTPVPGTPLFDAAIDDGFIAPHTLEEWAEVYWNKIDQVRWPREINDCITQFSRVALEKSWYLKGNDDEEVKV